MLPFADIITYPVQSVAPTAVGKVRPSPALISVVPLQMGQRCMSRGINHGNLSFTCQICIVDRILNDSALIREPLLAGLILGAFVDIFISIGEIF